jgi:hypothetical protein
VNLINIKELKQESVDQGVDIQELNMKIYIPTMARINRQHTVKQLVKANVHKEYECHLVVPDKEKDLYGDYIEMGFKIVPTELYGISNIRQFLVETCSDDKILMMDDDMSFHVRPLLDDYDLYVAEGHEIFEMVKWLDNVLTDYAHAGIPTRKQNFQLTKRIVRKNSYDIESTRVTHLHAFNTPIIKGEGLDFNAGMDINTMEDFHMVLSLLELGYPNIVCCKWAHEPKASNAPGGATLYRSLERHARCANNLRDKHPETVKVVERKTISSWGGSRDKPTIRTDVRIQWQKALGIKAKESKL